MPNLYPGKFDLSPGNANSSMHSGEMSEVDGILGKLNDVDFCFARVVMTAVTLLPTIDLLLRRQLIRWRFAACGVIDQDHPVILDCFPASLNESFGDTRLANPSVSIELPAVKRTLKPVSLDFTIGQVGSQVGAESLKRCYSASVAAEKSNLLPQALNVPYLSRLNVFRIRHPVPPVRERRGIGAFPAFLLFCHLSKTPPIVLASTANV